MNIQWYPGHMTKAKRAMKEDIKLIDLVIELVDARVPLSSRNPDIDDLAKGKARMVLLNKSDLADERVNAQWAAWFEAKNIHAVKVDSRNKGTLKQVQSVVQEACKEKIERDRKRGIMNRPIRTMVVGIPNVGKSTFINSFAGAARAKAANKPGVTRGKQWITVDDYDLMDMPGVLWKKFDSLETATNLAFIGSIKDDILDIEELACGLLSGVRVIYPQRLMERYKLDEQALALPPYDLLQAIGAKRGMLISGGEVDTERAAKMLVGEFRASKWGRISLERPPQRAEVTDWEGDDADEDEQ